VEKEKKRRELQEFVLKHKPIAKQRAMPVRMGKGVKMVYKQKPQVAFVKREILRQMKQMSFMKKLSGPLCVEMDIIVPYPKSYSKRLENIGTPVTKKPDIDNYQKFYLDVMNDLVYEDDRLICENWCRKRYGEEGKVIIRISEVWKDMIKEHVLTKKQDLTVEDLNYMAEKANRLGLTQRKLFRCVMEEDGEGKHYYYEVQGMGNGD